MDTTAIDFCGVAVSVGSDRTVRVWKYEEEKQLVFHGGGLRASIDCVSLFNDRFCVTGSQDARICLWDLTKKRPVQILRDPHGEGNWVASVAAFRYRMMFATGSNNGEIRFWEVGSDNKIVLRHTVELKGYVNDLHFSDDGKFLAAQVSQEQRFGKWLPAIQEARQGVYIIEIEEVRL
jgi:ribosomal RNA-processing protein 9